MACTRQGVAPPLQSRSEMNANQQRAGTDSPTHAREPLTSPKLALHHCSLFLSRSASSPAPLGGGRPPLTRGKELPGLATLLKSRFQFKRRRPALCPARGTKLGRQWFPGEASLQVQIPSRVTSSCFPSRDEFGKALGLPAAGSMFCYNQQSVLKCRHNDNVMRALIC